MRFQLVLALPVAIVLAALSAAAENAATPPSPSGNGAPRAKAIDPVVAPVRRVMPVTPPPSRDLGKGAAAAKGRAGKAGRAKAGKGAANSKVTTTIAKPAARTAGKAPAGKTGAVKSVKATGKPGKTAAKAAAAPASKKQAAAQTGPTR